MRACRKYKNNKNELGVGEEREEKERIFTRKDTDEKDGKSLSAELAEVREGKRGLVVNLVWLPVLEPKSDPSTA